MEALGSGPRWRHWVQRSRVERPALGLRVTSGSRVYFGCQGLKVSSGVGVPGSRVQGWGWELGIGVSSGFGSEVCFGGRGQPWGQSSGSGHRVGALFRGLGSPPGLGHGVVGPVLRVPDRGFGAGAHGCGLWLWLQLSSRSRICSWGRELEVSSRVGLGVSSGVRTPGSRVQCLGLGLGLRSRALGSSPGQGLRSWVWGEGSGVDGSGLRVRGWGLGLAPLQGLFRGHFARVSSSVRVSSRVQGSGFALGWGGQGQVRGRLWVWGSGACGWGSGSGFGVTSRSVARGRGSGVEGLGLGLGVGAWA